ncbi:hypothetical protein SAMN06295888_1294 [Desulfonatronum zhilinae]|nr:hypothetical protein SAMN06295888_1294 [Desulfonatronum zhilinae]
MAFPTTAGAAEVDLLFYAERSLHLSFLEPDPSDLECKGRNAVLEADSMRTLRENVIKALDQPETLEEERLQYIEELDYGRDGKSVQRAAEVIRELLVRPRNVKSRPTYSVLLELDQVADSSAERDAVSEIYAKSEDLPMELLPVKVPAEAASPGGFEVGRGTSSLGVRRRLARACAAAEGDWVVLVQPGWGLPRQWLKWMEYHFHWHRQVRDGQGSGGPKAGAPGLRPAVSRSPVYFRQ